MVKKESLATKVLTNIGTHPGKWTLGLGAIAYAKLKHSKLKKNIIYLLWGKHAQSYKSLINEGNYILEASHPVNEIYKGRRKGGFLGCDHFNIANEIIKKQHGEDEQIQWLYTPEQVEFLHSDNIKDNFDEI